MRQIIFVLAISLFPSSLIAQKVGDIVVVIAEIEAELKKGQNVVGTAYRGSHLRVDDVGNERFWVFWKGKKGWIHKSDTIPIDKAIDFFTTAIRRNPTASDYTIRGMVWRIVGEYDFAIKDHNEAIRLDSSMAAAYNNRGNAWHKKGEYERAIKDYNEAIKLDSRNSTDYNNRGYTWSIKGEYEKAIKDHNEAIRLDPKNSVVYNNRGIAWKDKGEYDKAIMDFKTAIRLDPMNSLPYSNMAWTQATCPVARYRDGRKAVENALKACEMTNWKNDFQMDTLAASYAEKGDFVEAIRWQKKAIELAPAEAKAEFRSVLKLYKSGKPYREKPKK